MGLLVRSWNVYHGRTSPPSRKLYLEEMIRLVTADGPDIVALQEVPVWALRRLGRWSGMRAAWVRTMPALLGPLAGLVTALDPVRFRSAATGQANAILVNPHLPVRAERSAVLNPELSPRDRLLRRKHRRVASALEIEAGGRTIVVANLHTNPDPDEVRRVVELVGPAERALLCGDFNIPRHVVPGFSAPIEGIDQILARGLEFERPPLCWEDERRRLDGGLLSDHAPVEAVIT